MPGKHIRYSILCIFIPITLTSCTSLAYPPPTRFQPENNELLLKVVKETKKISQIPFIYLSNDSRNRSLSSLVHRHHEESTATIIGYDTIFKAHQGPRNILFTLTDCPNIFSLILSSVEANNIKQTPPFTKYNQFSFKNESFPCVTSSELPNYCIDYVEGTRTMRHGDAAKACDIVVNVTESDLRPGSEMSDSLFELTRGVFQHPVWNAENYLIFALQPESTAIHHTDYIHCDLFFTFRFIWRLYQGFRTVICIAEACFRYDPFRGAIDLYTLKSDAYFSFSLPDLRGYEIRTATTPQVELFDDILPIKKWSWFVRVAMTEVVEGMGGFCVETALPGDVPKDFSGALKRDISVMIFEGSLKDTDFHQFDVVTLRDHGAISFVVPDRGFMPSYLTPAKCFSATVWVFILIVLILFAVVHEIYKRLSVKIYTEAANDVSTAFTIFSYFICVGQTRLLLNSPTGRILFTVITFTFMILSTLFLSLMTTFFSQQVRYAPFDTHDDLKQSDLLFQLMLAENDSLSFMDDPSYEWLKERTRDSVSKLLKACRSGEKTIVSYIPETDEIFQLGEYWNISEITVKGVMKNIDEMIKNYGFIVFLPRSEEKRELISVPPIYSNWSHDFHVVKESIMSYPYDMRLMRGSIYGDKIKAYVARFIEAGILEELYEIHISPMSDQFFTEFEDDLKVPRAFNMADLRLAFIVLIFGNILSSFVFMVELLYSI
ncbi:unnamed protein product [Bemisia tabaci]|uniref:Ionotropic receptor n=1 Tax=Bemisia tabaci TaxID=7038 RepID=A0A9P0A2R7_BEMTA|nr:unnamed protein product [Bemisia tabaci]